MSAGTKPPKSLVHDTASVLIALAAFAVYLAGHQHRKQAHALEVSERRLTDAHAAHTRLFERVQELETESPVVDKERLSALEEEVGRLNWELDGPFVLAGEAGEALEASQRDRADVSPVDALDSEPSPLAGGDA
jgi:hypothetical protein